MSDSLPFTAEDLVERRKPAERILWGNLTDIHNPRLTPQQRAASVRMVGFAKQELAACADWCRTLEQVAALN